MVAKLKVDQLETVDGTGIITANNPLAGDGASLTGLNATNLGSGTVPTARLGTGTADADNFLRGDGAWAEAGGGKVLQVVSATSTSSSSTTSTTYVASNLTASITPADAANKVLVLITSVARVSTTGTMYYTLYEDGVDIGGSVDNRGMGKIYHNANHMVDIPISLIHLASPASTSAVTYTLYYLADGSVTAECPPTNNMIQNIVLMEIAV
jgi:hypothetical protein